ncbi:HAD-like protein [Neoconidiobolus thromboides FSU 785]|nr:HAD-like protein [Neoconidiobolus thromboides FSU 785]
MSDVIPINLDERHNYNNNNNNRYRKDKEHKRYRTSRYMEDRNYYNNRYKEERDRDNNRHKESRSHYSNRHREDRNYNISRYREDRNRSVYRYREDNNKSLSANQRRRVNNSQVLNKEQTSDDKKQGFQVNINERDGDYWKLKEELTTYKSVDRNKLVVVFDLNGVLIRRTSKDKRVILRPWLQALLDYCDQNYNVIFWSSVMPASMLQILIKILPNYKQKLVRIYTRNHCTLSGRYNSKCDTIKNLEKLWEDLNFEFNDKNLFNDKNTIIVDDSIIKCKLQPNNQIVPDIYQRDIAGEQDTELHYLKHYLNYVNEEYHKNVKLFDVKKIIKQVPFANFKELCQDTNDL